MKHKYLLVASGLGLAAVSGLVIKTRFRERRAVRPTGYYTTETYEQSLLDYQKSVGLFVRKYPRNGPRRAAFRFKSCLKPMAAIQELVGSCEITSMQGFEDFTWVWAKDLLYWAEQKGHKPFVEGLFSYDTDWENAPEPEANKGESV